MHVTSGTRNRDSVYDQTENDSTVLCLFRIPPSTLPVPPFNATSELLYQLELNEHGGKETVAIP
jgi:hypothetical protein